MKTGVIVARFQVPILHKGHLHLLDEVYSRSDQVVFVLGSPSIPNERNPLPFSLRQRMLKEEWIISGYDDIPISFEEILDHHEDALWSEHLDAILDKYENATLYGSRDCFHKFYTGKYPFESIPEVPNVSGTDVRNNWETENAQWIDWENYRAGYMAGALSILKLDKNGSNGFLP